MRKPMRKLLPDEAYSAASSLTRHLTMCALEHLGDDMHDWVVPPLTASDPAVTYRVDPDLDEVQLIGPDGQRYGLDVSVIAYPLPPSTEEADDEETS